MLCKVWSRNQPQQNVLIAVKILITEHIDIDAIHILGSGPRMCTVSSLGDSLVHSSLSLRFVPIITDYVLSYNLTWHLLYKISGEMNLFFFNSNSLTWNCSTTKLLK